MLKHILAASLLAVSPLANADTVTGLLEKGQKNSAILSFSPESGDLIAYYFKNDSKAGKSVLSNCLKGMLCRIDQATLAARDQGPEQIGQGASAVFEIMSAREVYMEGAAFDYDDPSVFVSRFGTLRTGEDGTLRYNDKPVQPEIQANFTLNVVANVEFKNYDLVLIENVGGTGCPAIYHFVRLDASGVKVSEEFGTCSNIFFLSMTPDDFVQVAMTGFRGPMEPEAEQRRALMTKHIYRYTNNGKVTELR